MKKTTDYKAKEGQELAIETEHGFIYVSQEEFNDVKDRYEVEQKYSDCGCYALRFEIIECYTKNLTIGRAVRWKKVK